MTDIALWAQFRGLLPRAPLLLVEVISHDTDGSSIVQLPGTASQFKARGTGVAEGAFAFVRDGVIEGEAPAVSTILDLLV
jgi:hypothetical protein